MTLTDRVSAFFLATLGVALAIYSVAFYTVAREHIVSQFADELHGTLGSLVAAAEVEETEVKWQPLEHSIEIGGRDEFGEIQWIVLGDGGQIVERSRKVDEEFLSLMGSLTYPAVAIEQSKLEVKSLPGWTVLQQRLFAPRPDRLLRELDEFDQLTVFVGRPTSKRDAILVRLGWLVTIPPLIGWGIAAVLGRWLVRKALQPVRGMASQASSISGADFDARLTFSETKDELEELGTSFNRLLDRQQNAYEQQRRFAGNAAHELRTPITILLGQIEVALRRPRTAEEYKSNLELLKSDASSLQEIVESLLFLARSDGDGQSIQLRKVSLAEWIDEHRSVWEMNPRRDDLQIEHGIPPDVYVSATPALLSRIVDNLVFNAMKYSRVGTPIRVQTSADGEFAEIRVTDCGNGIAARDIPNLFDPFFRTSEARRLGISGTGLGLSIASRIANLLHGTLRCESEQGVGSTFTLRLPR